MLMKSARLLLLLATVAITTGLVLGQSAQSNNEKIRRLRDEITKRQTADVPADVADLNQSILIERRAELRTALKVEVENLRKHRAFLGSSATLEEIQKIEDSLQSYAAEIDRLATEIANDLQTERRSVSTPVAKVSASIPESKPATDNQSNQVSAISPKPVTVPARSTSVAGLSTSATISDPSTVDTKLAMLPAAPPDTNETNATLDCAAILARTKTASELDMIVCGLADSYTEKRKNDAAVRNSLLQISDSRFELLKMLIAKRTTPKYLVEAEEVRLDKQVGAAPANNGSTSLVVKGGVPTMLGFAVENGGLTQSLSGTGITFRGNPVGLFNALKNRGFVSSAKADENDPIIRFLKKTSFAFTFNTDRGSQPGVFTGTSQQLSSVSARLEFINNRRPRLYIKDWENFLADKAQNLANVINATNRVFFNDADPLNPQWLDPKMQAWYQETQSKLIAASDADVSAVLQARLDALPVKELRPETALALDEIEQALGLYLQGRTNLLNKINSGTLVTLEYVNKREVNAPDTHTFNFIAEKGTGGGKIDFTFNGSLTMFNNLDSLKNFIIANPTLPPARRLRDFQFAGQIDVPLGDPTEFGNFVLFAAGRYQRLLQDATTELGTILPNTKGDIAYLQTGLKIPLKGTGLKIPLSFTFANRSEFVKEKHVRGNIGFTLDLDSLFARFRPF
ncbi:MAG TPA: hypothetical protein VJV03_04880 [Pyrinomonadaceae bacterium]|nr:hypothetical protein [Pyrinomonadaceae bacterium]